MFEYHLIGKSGPYEELPLISPCGKWLLDRKGRRVIDVTRGAVAFELCDPLATQDMRGHCGLSELADGRIRVSKWDRDTDKRIVMYWNPKTGEIQSSIEDVVGRAETWEHKGQKLTHARPLYDRNDVATEFCIFHEGTTVILVNTETGKTLADMSEAAADFLSGTKQAETVVRGAGVELTTKHEGTAVPLYEISSIKHQGPHLVITFKQNFGLLRRWTGVMGELWFLYYHFETGECRAVTASIAGLTEAGNTVSVRDVLPNGAVLFSTNGKALFQDLMLYCPNGEIKVLLGKKDRFQGCQRARLIPHPDEIQLLHHAKAGAQLLRFDSEGKELERRSLDLPYLHTLTKEAWLAPVDVYKGYYYFNNTKEGGIAVDPKNWKVVRYPSPKFTCDIWRESLRLRSSGWFGAELRGRYVIGYLSFGELPPEVLATCKLLGAKTKLANPSPAAKPAPAPAQTARASGSLLDTLLSIGFFEGYSDKVREKMEGKLRRCRKTHIIDQLELAGIVLDDAQMGEERLSNLIAGKPYGVMRVIDLLPEFGATRCQVEIDGKKMQIHYKRGAKELCVKDLDATCPIEETLAFCDLILKTHKMPAKAFFVAKDNKATILCTSIEAIDKLDAQYDLIILEASRELSAHNSKK